MKKLFIFLFFVGFIIFVAGSLFRFNTSINLDNVGLIILGFSFVIFVYLLIKKQFSFCGIFLLILIILGLGFSWFVPIIPHNAGPVMCQIPPCGSVMIRVTLKELFLEKYEKYEKRGVYISQNGDTLKIEYYSQYAGDFYLNNIKGELLDRNGDKSNITLNKYGEGSFKIDLRFISKNKLIVESSNLEDIQEGDIFSFNYKLNLFK